MPDADAPTPDRHRELIRDLGGLEKVYVEWTEGQLQFCSIYVEELGEETRILSLESHELSRVVDVLEQAEADMTQTEEEPYVE
jgi:hypothetical protein